MSDPRHDSSVRGIGGLLVAAAIALIADHIGMPYWKVVTVFLCVSVGLPMAIGGRWKNW
jgi:uncharacterized membrane protein YccC